MLSRMVLAGLTTVLVAGSWLAAGAEPDEVVVQTPRAVAFEPLPLGAIKPSGWLKEQLRVQAAGLSGHLDEFWPDIKDSAWFGGKAEGWERVPYWIDGLVPLAYLLDDERLKLKVKNALGYILDHQHPDGWLGPVGDSQKHKPYDVWPLFPLLKALTQYHEATADPRVVPALLKCCRKIDQVIAREPMYSWARFRAADLVVTLHWLHERAGEPWLLDLARRAFAQSHDWAAQFRDFKFTEKTRDKFELDTHGVNTGMALKYAGVRYQLSAAADDKDAVFRMLEQLDRYHGQATGIFTCDEHLAGRSPSQGTELCTVVEAMYSLEVLAGILADSRLGDRLEKLAFNALPATFSKDMTAHQYDQQANQVVCSAAGEHVYVNNKGDSNLFGLEPNFGCCTANMHQGWPKLASHLWMKSSDDGLAVIAYAPCVVETSIRGVPVQLAVETAYPFREQVQIKTTVPKGKSLTLHLRIPAWAREARVRSHDTDVLMDLSKQGWKPGGAYLPLDLKEGGTTTTTLGLPMPVRLYEGYEGAMAIERGPLVYALPIDARWQKLKDRENVPFDDWEVYPTSAWNYALSIDRDHPERSVTFENQGEGAVPFSAPGAPVIARVKGRRLPGWGLETGAAAPPPRSPVSSDQPLEDLTLVPYGCTALRITEFPTLGSR
jgi:hypothetical protein